MRLLLFKIKVQNTTIIMPYIEAIDYKSKTNPNPNSNLQLAKLSEDYAIKSKIACSIWLEKKYDRSTRMLARFLRYNSHVIITNIKSFVLLFITANIASFMTVTICSEYYALR